MTILLLGGCQPKPNKSEIEETIVTYFGSKNYKVVELETGDIKPIPFSEKEYMGTPGYVIDVPLLTLQRVNKTETRGDYGEGEQLRFMNARILIRRHNGQGREWIIANMSGINAP